MISRLKSAKRFCFCERTIRGPCPSKGRPQVFFPSKEDKPHSNEAVHLEAELLDHGVAESFTLNSEFQQATQSGVKKLSTESNRPEPSLTRAINYCTAMACQFIFFVVVGTVLMLLIKGLHN